MLCPGTRHINSPGYWLIPRKQWLRPDMTEKLLTLMFNLKTAKFFNYANLNIKPKSMEH